MQSSEYILAGINLNLQEPELFRYITLELEFDLSQISYLETKSKPAPHNKITSKDTLILLLIMIPR